MTIDWSYSSASGFGLACLQYKEVDSSEWMNATNLCGIELNIADPNEIELLTVRMDGIGYRLGRVDDIFITDETSTLEEGLVAYYPFNGNANDESGNGYDGIESDVSYATDRFGNEVGASYFNGSAEVIVADNDSFNFGTGDFSISVWINPSDQDNNHILGKDTWAGFGTTGKYSACF